jgi:aspartate kinase
VPREDVAATHEAIEAVTSQLGPMEMDVDDTLGKVSLIGAGMRSHPGIAAKMFRTLANEQINLRMISTSPIKISCMISKDEIPLALRALHTAFALDFEPTEEQTVRG